MTSPIVFGRIASWWLTPMPATRLGGVRIACGTYALCYLLPRCNMFHELWRTDADLFDPVGMARLLPGVLPPGIMDTVYWLTVLTGVFFTLGFKHRIAGPLFGLLLFTLLSYRNSWSMILHMHNALVIHAMILGISRSADGWSVDAALYRRRGGVPPGSSWRYGWPIMLVGAVTIIAYFLSGVAKLACPEGLDWAAGEALRSQIAVNAIRYDILEGESAPLFQTIYQHKALFWGMGIGTFVLELGVPLALLNRRLGVIWAIMVFGMHWGIFFVMGIKFRYQMSGLTYASFFDLEKMACPKTPLAAALRKFALNGKASLANY